MDMIRTLLKKLSDQLPVDYEKTECFYYLAKDKLSEFETELKSLDSTDMSDFLKQAEELECSPTSESFINLIHKIKNTCLEILQYAYRGQILEATTLLDKLLSVPKYTDYKLSDWYFNYMSSAFENSVNLYRCVDFSDDEEDPKDCNHVPFQLRGSASNVRFNLLGYPCLYLCSSLECAQKELGNVAERKVRWYGEFRPKRQLCLLDFTLPSDETIDNMSVYDMFCFLVTYPLRLLCSYKMKDNDASFNEEYTFSQLFLHTMFLNKKNEYPGFDGISYSSMYDRKCVNYVFPALYYAKEPPTEGHSQHILDMFEQVSHQKIQ